MPESPSFIEAPLIIERSNFQQLIDALIKRGYRPVGPVLRDGAIIYDEIRHDADLPIGWTDEQQAGAYRLTRRADQALFGYAVGPHSWKKFLLLADVRLWAARKTESGLEFVENNDEIPKLAFIGVRSCELHAIAAHDKVFLEGKYADPIYSRRRNPTFIVAVNCGQAGGTCFCASMNTGPRASFGFDLLLTEVIDRCRHFFVVESGTQRGAEVLNDVPNSPATSEQVEAAKRAVANAAAHMGRELDTNGIKELFYRNYENPRWDDVAKRCLACANCTMVCPTCFCTTIEDVTDLAGNVAERWRKLDSCFTLDFSYIHGGSVRSSMKSRYRQWITHKLATWIDQFGTSGCVGCGRCIAWCPVAIDITQEASAIRESERARKERANGDA